MPSGLPPNAVKGNGQRLVFRLLGLSGRAAVVMTSRMLTFWRAAVCFLDQDRGPGSSGGVAPPSHLRVPHLPSPKGWSMAEASPEDQQLAARLRQGDEATFAQLYRRHTPAMQRLAAAITGRTAAGEEVTHDTWLTVLDKIDTFQGRSSLSAWIFAILANKARSKARREGRMISFDEQGQGGGQGGGQGLADAFDGKGRWRTLPGLWEEVTPERIVAGRKLVDHMQEAIAALPDTQRAVLILRVQQGLEASEVCSILEISPTNMRVLLHRARLALRARLAALS